MMFAPNVNNQCIFIKIFVILLLLKNKFPIVVFIHPIKIVSNVSKDFFWWMENVNQQQSKTV